MAEFSNGWFVSVLPSILLVLISGIGARRLAVVHDELEGRIRTEADLHRVRAAINFNMAAALVIMAVFGTAFVYIGYAALTKRFTMNTVTLHFVVLSAAGLIGHLLVSRVEARFKAMDASASPELTERFSRYIRQWHEPRLQLPK